MHGPIIGFTLTYLIAQSDSRPRRNMALETGGEGKTGKKTGRVRFLTRWTRSSGLVV